MNSEIILAFTSNLMLLMSLAVIYSIFPHETKLKEIYVKILMGVLVSFIGVSIMYSRFELMDGIYFDARAVAISVSGMFLGFIPTLIGGIVMISYRIYLGGAGTLTGALWVVFAGTISVAFTGLIAIVPPLQIVAVLFAIVGFGFTVTSTLNVPPVQFPVDTPIGFTT